MLLCILPGTRQALKTVTEPTLWASETPVQASHCFQPQWSWWVDSAVYSNPSLPRATHQVFPQWNAATTMKVSVPLAFLGVWFCFLIPQLEKSDHEVVRAVASCNETAAVAIIWWFVFFLIDENMELLVSGTDYECFKWTNFSVFAQPSYAKQTE